MRLIIIIVLSTFSLSYSRAQSIAQTYQLGIKAYELNNYEACIDFMSRVSYFDSNNQYKSDANYYIAQCLVATHQITAAYKHYELSANFTINSEKQNRILLEKARLMILEKDFKFAIQELYQLYIPEESNLFQVHQFFLFTALYGNNQYDKSKQHLLKCIESSDSIQVLDIYNQITKKLNPKRPSRAQLYSVIIPGSGQFYAGDVKNALNSMALMTGIVYLYFNTAKNYGFISAFVSILPWVSRYHTGGGKNANRAMLKRQEKLKGRYYKQLIELTPKEIRQ